MSVIEFFSFIKDLKKIRFCIVYLKICKNFYFYNSFYMYLGLLNMFLLNGLRDFFFF